MSESPRASLARGGVDSGRRRAGHDATEGNASPRRRAAERFRQRERLDAIDRDTREPERLPAEVASAIDRQDLERVARALFMSPADLAKRLLIEAQGVEAVRAWRSKPANVEQLNADAEELQAAISRARDACERRGTR